VPAKHAQAGFEQCLLQIKRNRRAILDHKPSGGCLPPD